MHHSVIGRSWPCKANWIVCKRAVLICTVLEKQWIVVGFIFMILQVLAAYVVNALMIGTCTLLLAQCCTLGHP